MPEISDKAQEAIKKSLAEYPDRWRNGICAFVFVDRETGHTSGSPTGDVCHASLNRCDDKRSIVINAHKPNYHGKYPDFVRWVCRESPYAAAVLNKDNDDEILTQGIVIEPAEIGGGGALWLCKATRHTVESMHTIPVWRRLMEAGLNPLQAFIGSDILQADGKPKKTHDHVGLFTYDTAEKIREFYDFIKVGPKLPKGQAALPKGWPSYVGPVWGSMTEKKVRKPDGWGGYIEIGVPTNEKEYVAILKEIFEGDPKNVK